jgi:hypothetical protein
MNWQEIKQASLDDILTWAESQPWCRAMAACAQDAQWHSEGDVWTHTKMLCQQLVGLSEWPTLASDERTVLTFTALFHDAAKPLTSEADPETGRITSPKHAVMVNDHLLDCFRHRELAQRSPSPPGKCGRMTAWIHPGQSPPTRSMT